MFRIEKLNDYQKIVILIRKYYQSFVKDTFLKEFFEHTLCLSEFKTKNHLIDK